MIKLIKKIIIQFLRKFSFGKLLIGLYALSTEYLKDTGWMNSFKSRSSIDRYKKPLPWFTYSCIDFLEPRLKKDFDVFEFGSGNSTLWFAERTNHVTTLEHDPEWHPQLEPMFKDVQNVDYEFKNLPSGDYQNEALKYEESFDLVILDGRERIQCCKNSIKALKKNGVIVWDNTDRSKYQEGYDFLKENGFRRLDFWGLGPISTFSWCSSVFYRKENCLGI